MDIVIRNTGNTVATDVQFAFDPPLQSMLGENNPRYRVGETAMLTRGIPTLPPGREHRLLFDNMPTRYESALPRSYNCVVTFKDARKRSHTLEYRLDLDMYFGLMTITVYGAHETAKALQELSKTVQNWTSNRGFEVWTNIGDDHDEDERIVELGTSAQ